MPSLPTVDINLFVYNGAATVADAIECVLAQTWPAVALTLIDDGSTDGTLAVLRNYAAQHPTIRLKRNRCNGGAIANFQRAFWFGDADFVMPKSADDCIVPDFVERLMMLLLDRPRCAMAHGAGCVIDSADAIGARYPAEHCLNAIGDDAMARSREVMTRYTSSPSFWGVYRRTAVDQLSPIRYRAGWDHVLLAELALYGEIRHLPEPIYLRRDGGKPVLQLARAATRQSCARLSLDDVLAEQRWRTPLITTAYAHIEMFAAARLPCADRLRMMREVPGIFRARWLPWLRHEAEALHRDIPAMLEQLGRVDALQAGWMARALIEVLQGVAAIVPEVDLSLAQLEITAAASEVWHDAAIA